MKKLSLCSLLLSCTNLSGCGQKSRPIDHEVLIIPAECKQAISLNQEAHRGWNLLCKDSLGNEVFYYKAYTSIEEEWEKYKLVRK